MSALPRLSVLALIALGAPAVACEPEYVSMGYDEAVVNRGTMPTGPVWSCYGSGCPYGDCDNDEAFSDVDCDDVYPGPVDDQALFCQPGWEDSYCLVLSQDVFGDSDYWAVTCSGGFATAMECGRGCGDSSGDGASCL